MDRVQLIFKSICFLIGCTLLASCSLNYEDNRKESLHSSPELSFQTVIFNRYENNKITVSVSADKIEQYTSNVSYAKQASFDFWNEKNERQVTGSCKLMSIQTYKNIFALYDDIQITDIKNESEINASALKWDSGKKFLVSDKSKMVRLSKKKIEIEGTCFSAAEETNSFEFASGVSGIIHLEEGN